MTGKFSTMTNPELDAIVVNKDRYRDIGLDVVCMADVQARPIEWLWPDWIAVGKVSMLSGEGGQGKSTLLCDLAARTTIGDNWPDGALGSSPGGVVMLTAEDGLEDTLKPRLVAAGADVSRIINIRAARTEEHKRRVFNFQEDLDRLEKAIVARGDVRLVIIDPISSYLGRGVDSHKNADVRNVLEPIGDMAVRAGVAIVCNNHFAKGAGSANNRAIGSVAFVNYVRSAFIVTPDAETEGRMLMIQAKNNIAPIKYGMAYRIESYVANCDGTDIMTSRMCWELDPVKITADAALAAHAGTDESRSMKAEAMDFLTTFLAEGKSPAAVVKSAATQAGITAKSLRSAREALGVRPFKDGMDGGWVWELPKMPSGVEDAQDACLTKRAPSGGEGTFGTDPDGWNYQLDDEVRE